MKQNKISIREEFLFDHQFFGDPGGPTTAAQQRILTYVSTAVGGILTTLNFIYFLKKEIENNMPEIAEGLGLKKGADNAN